MAGIGETAKLLASLDLDDSRFQTGVNRSVGGINKLDSRLKALGSNARQIGKGFGQVGTGLERAFTKAALVAGVAVGAFASQVKAGLDSLIQLDRIQRQTQAVLKSTGGAAGVTGDQVRSLAEQFEDLTTIDDKAIQATENMLLTFTSISSRHGIFKDALQAVLDMNTAMGGDESSLTNVAIQVGKALNDPIRGVTALRRVGVTFTDQQLKQIATLVKQGKLYKAQKIILAELAREFGGSAGAFGQTTEGKIRRVQDAIEDAQKALATAFLPVLEKVADRLSKFLKEPGTIRAIEDFGKKVAGLFSDENLAKGERFVEGIWDRLQKVDWAGIKTGLKNVADLAGKVVDAFLKLPPAAQEAIIGGLVVNKLSGGLVGQGAGNIAGGVIGAVGNIGGAIIGKFFQRGSSPANPVWVAGTGVGGGVPPTGGGLGKVGTALAVATGLGAAAEFGVTAADYLKGIDEQTKSVDDKMTDLLNTGPTKEVLQKQLAALKEVPDKLDPIKRILFETNAGNVRGVWQRQVDKLEAQIRSVDTLTAVLRAKRLSVVTNIDLQDFIDNFVFNRFAFNEPTSTSVSTTGSLSQFSTSQAYARQHGGPTRQRHPYLVGETGPELFVPDENGRVVPNGILTARSHGGNAYAYGMPNINVYLDSRRITARQRRGDIWHSVVDQ